MNSSLYNAYSDVYNTAMMRDVKPQHYVAIANKSTESRFGKLVRLLSKI
jgi:hypothetical protein